jgi:DNA-binding transcriptional ArsR family regulator
MSDVNNVRPPSMDSASVLARTLGEPVRLRILLRLMEGPATVADLVTSLSESQPKVSNHLAVLRERGLVRVGREGRQSIYRLCNPSVAQLIESLVAISGAGKRRPLPSAPIALARTCYDHLAGRLGVALLDALTGQGALLPDNVATGDLRLSPSGTALLRQIGVEIEPGRRTGRRYAYACLDWTVRRHHLGGVLGARLCQRAIASGWVEKDVGSRAVHVTSRGRRALKRYFGIGSDAWRAAGGTAETDAEMQYAGRRLGRNAGQATV